MLFKKTQTEAIGKFVNASRWYIEVVKLFADREVSNLMPSSRLLTLTTYIIKVTS